MSETELLIRQTKDAYGWTHKLVTSVPFEKWDETPEVIETNATWQVGHLIMSHYFHAIMVIAGHQMDILQTVPIKAYNLIFTDGAPRNVIGKTNPSDLLNQLTMVQEKSLQILSKLSAADLAGRLEPTAIHHPIAKTKFESLDWNIKHTMYHCGQIGILKRVVHERHDFGLRRPE
jgi:hypothetical protein